MKRGQRVGWFVKSQGKAGEGFLIADPDDKGKVPVAVTHLGGDEQEMHYVIYCNVTWLKPLDTVDEVAGQEAPPAG